MPRTSTIVLLRKLLRGLGVPALVVTLVVTLLELGWVYLPASSRQYLPGSNRHPSAASGHSPGQSRQPPVASGRVYNLQGRIVRVADGDTVTLLAGGTRYRIRLASIDAPETGHGRDKPGQPFGHAAQVNLQTLVAGQSLTARCYEQDHYGRQVCDLLLTQRPTVNALQVAAGYAWANTMRHGIYLRDRALLTVEQHARTARKGLWRDPNPVAPWVWRHACWKQGECGPVTTLREIRR